MGTKLCFMGTMLCFMGTFALFYGNICFVFEHIRGLCLRYQLCFNRSQQSSSLSLSGLLVKQWQVSLFSPARPPPVYHCDVILSQFSLSSLLLSLFNCNNSGERVYCAHHEVNRSSVITSVETLFWNTWNMVLSWCGDGNMWPWLHLEIWSGNFQKMSVMLKMSLSVLS